MRGFAKHLLIGLCLTGALWFATHPAFVYGRLWAAALALLAIVVLAHAFWQRARG